MGLGIFRWTAIRVRSDYGKINAKPRNYELNPLLTASKNFNAELYKLSLLRSYEIADLLAQKMGSKFMKRNRIIQPEGIKRLNQVIGNLDPGITILPEKIISLEAAMEILATVINDHVSQKIKEKGKISYSIFFSVHLTVNKETLEISAGIYERPTLGDKLLQADRPF